MRFPEPGGSRIIARMLAAALIAAAAAGCSDASRFGDNAFSNPFASRREAAYQPPPAQAAPVARVEAAPLNAQSASPLPPPTPPPVAPAPGYYSQRDTTGSLTNDYSGAAGAITITVASGDTVDAIARRYGVSSAAIVQANRLSSAASIQAGQSLVIPRQHSAIRDVASKPAAPRVAASHTRTAPGGTHVVAPGETLSSVARLYGKPRAAIAKANNITSDTKLRVGQALTIPGAKSTRVAAAGSVHPPQASSAGHVAAAPIPAHSQPPQRVATAEAGVPLPAPEPAVAKIESPAEMANAAGGFRWPVRGRVIAGFGSETSGQHNDGINLAVPEGTSIKAAEEGTVAYAGNELKGYGNLLLVRHSNGFVTAYAHASELLVKRGDQVKRGQIIARAGQTGSVSSPQLHFEIRKGATPVDPMRYLSGT
jgi:murein DD-endopeptidase MepM/ murein hydrolase activator NlpD